MFILLTYSARVFLVYFFTFLSTRIMTKKAIAEMTAYEIAGLMVLANVAAEPLVDKVVIKSVYGVGVLVVLILLTGRVSIINRFTAIFEHTATVVIENGQIDMKALKRLSLSLNQLVGLLGELKKQGIKNYKDQVALAELDPSWNIVVLKK